MKRAPGESFLHRLISLVTRNFGLKLLSLALAIVIYEVLSPRAATEENPDPTPATEHVSTNT